MEDNFAPAVNLTDGVAFMYQRPMSPVSVGGRTSNAVASTVGRAGDGQGHSTVEAG